ncbi:hypothetical protein J4Q44_G00169250 [Coregonus suidteri]|uniref:Uncharacterized protein n=1 Tax=Coregonus suidteri TaxID=861788 RepID=A0AAN8QWQ3_9TELE
MCSRVFHLLTCQEDLRSSNPIRDGTLPLLENTGPPSSSSHPTDAFPTFSLLPQPSCFSTVWNENEIQYITVI